MRTNRAGCGDYCPNTCGIQKRKVSNERCPIVLHKRMKVVSRIWITDNTTTKVCATCRCSLNIPLWDVNQAAAITSVACNAESFFNRFNRRRSKARDEFNGEMQNVLICTHISYTNKAKWNMPRPDSVTLIHRRVRRQLSPCFVIPFR